MLPIRAKLSLGTIVQADISDLYFASMVPFVLQIPVNH